MMTDWKEIDILIDKIICELQESGLTDNEIAFTPLEEWVTMLQGKGIDGNSANDYLVNCF